MFFCKRRFLDSLNLIISFDVSFGAAEPPQKAPPTCCLITLDTSSFISIHFCKRNLDKPNDEQIIENNSKTLRKIIVRCCFEAQHGPRDPPKHGRKNRQATQLQYSCVVYLWSFMHLRPSQVC